MPFEYRENQNRIYDYCVHREGDEKPMQCFETAEEAQAYWMGLTISEKLEAEKQQSKMLAEALLQMLEKK
jgi:dsDNA-binding SOS-regulon protein